MRLEKFLNYFSHLLMQAWKPATTRNGETPQLFFAKMTAPLSGEPRLTILYYFTL